MTSSVTKIRVFVSSPGDVISEADQVPRIIEELNRTIGRKFDLFIEPVSWKSHCYPQMGRTQAVIHELIGPYDIYLGIMWNRFGTPTGEADSGTEEEFREAYAEWERDNNLPILFYFSLAPATLKTEKELDQRRKVINFQEELSTKGLVWYYPSPSEFTPIVREHLTNTILNKFVQPNLEGQHSKNIVTEASGSTIPVASNSTALSDEISQKPSVLQLSEIFSALNTKLHEVTQGEPVASLYSLTPFQIVRNHLLSTTLMSTQSSSVLLDGQSTNQLYRDREKLAASSEESMLLFRAILNDDSDIIPGWYWLPLTDDKAPGPILLNRALKDPLPHIRSRAWDILTAAQIPLIEDETLWHDILGRAFEDSYELARRGATSYIGRMGTESELPILETVIRNDRSSLVRQEALLSQLLVLARYRPNEILLRESLPESNSETRKVIAELKSHPERIDDNVLLSARGHKNDALRVFVVEELVRKGILTKDIASSMVADSEGKVSQACYQFLISQGERIDPHEVYSNLNDETTYQEYHNLTIVSRPFANKEAVILEILRNYSEEDLLNLIQWESDIGHIAYKALAFYHFKSFSSRIKSDLKTEFAESADVYLKASIAKWKEIYSSSMGMSLRHFSRGLASRFYKEEDDSPEASAKFETESKKNKYIAAALSGIAQKGNPDDVIFGRNHLSNTNYNVRLEAVRVLDQFGSGTDVPVLIEIAKATDGVLRETAARAALKRASDVLEIARTLLLSKEKVLASVSIDFLLNEKNRHEIERNLEELLYNEDNIARIEAVRFFVNNFSLEQLLDLLNRYITRFPYYLDVVCWLDRILYAPKALQGFFKQELQSRS
jgi:HEAT repeat protein